MEFFWMFLIGMIAGWLAGQFMGGTRYGVVGDIIVGVIGALIGGILFEKAGLFAGSSLIGSLIVATTGAIVSLYGLRMVKKA
jgi:uncharacterized membrane protein YeaQ/YmgE (transglycosylase-associated protein family)